MMDHNDFRKVAHDIKNPLTAASLQLQVLALTGDEKTKKRVKIAIDEIDNASRLLTEFHEKIKADQQAQENNAK